MGGRVWTKQEILLLEEMWGVRSKKYIAKRLNRTEVAISLKAQRLGLGSFLESGDYISFNSLIKALGYSESGYLRTSWIKKRNFPVEKKKVGKRSFLVVTYKDFWRWAKKNQSFLNFDKFPKYALGKEPNWAKEKRKRDITSNIYRRKGQWSKKEDEYLVSLLKQYKWNIREIGHILQRDEDSIKTRIEKLNIKERPLPPEINKWTEEDKEKLFNMIKSEYNYTFISKEMSNRTLKGIKGFLYRSFGTQNLDIIRERLIK